MQVTPVEDGDARRRLVPLRLLWHCVTRACVEGRSRSLGNREALS